MNIIPNKLITAGHIEKEEQILVLIEFVNNDTTVDMFEIMSINYLNAWQACMQDMHFEQCDYRSDK